VTNRENGAILAYFNDVFYYPSHCNRERTYLLMHLPTQKAIDELAFENNGIIVDGINFTSDKQAIINALSIAVTNHWFKWPIIKGLLNQMRNYRRDEDTKTTKMPQDIVMTLGIAAFLARYLPEEIKEAVLARRPGGRPPRRVRAARRRGRA
jgi:hypothetical protein